MTNDDNFRAAYQSTCATFKMSKDLQKAGGVQVCNAAYKAAAEYSCNQYNKYKGEGGSGYVQGSSRVDL